MCASGILVSPGPLCVKDFEGFGVARMISFQSFVDVCVYNYSASREDIATNFDNFVAHRRAIEVVTITRLEIHIH